MVKTCDVSYLVCDGLLGEAMLVQQVASKAESLFVFAITCGMLDKQ